MQKSLKDMTLIEKKALAYDLLSSRDRTNNMLKAVQMAILEEETSKNPNIDKQ